MRAQQQLHLLPKPLPRGSYTVGTLLIKPSTSSNPLSPSVLGDRDYDDTHTVEWYKDILSLAPSGTFIKSLGANLFLPKQEPETQLVSLEAERMSIRTLKDYEGTLGRVTGTPDAEVWLKEQVKAGEEVYFVSAVKEVKNASFRRASVKEAGNGLVEVKKMAQTETQPDGERRDSGSDLGLGTTAKSDVIAVELMKVLVTEQDGKLAVKMGEVLNGNLWA